MTIKTINLERIEYHPSIELWRQDDGGVLVRRGYNLLDENGQQIYPSWLYHDEAVPWDQIPVDIQNAILAINDFIVVKIKEREGIDTNMVAPVITLIGEPYYAFDVGSTPVADPGATATDDIEGDISDRIRVGGDVIDWNTPGTYVITYDVTDIAGNDAVTVTRTVDIVDPTP